MNGDLREAVVLVSSAEFALKSSPVRRTLEQRLTDDLKFAMRKSNYCQVTAHRSAGRIVLQGVMDTMVAAQVCAKVFGVAHASPAMKVDCSLDKILREIVQLAKGSLLDGQSFGIRCHRSSPSMISPHEVEVLGGSMVLKELDGMNIGVNLRKPDLWISVDLSGESAYVYSIKIPGPGGFPLSSQWKAISILDADVLSLFAAYVMMRRGCLVHLLIPNSIMGDDSSLDRRLTLARKLRGFVTRENYRAFILRHHYPSDQTMPIRLLCLDLARQKRFNGIVFADVGGSIRFEKNLLDKSRELGLTAFQPLVGFTQDDLLELGRIFGVEWAEIESAFSTQGVTSMESSLADLSDFTVEQIFL